MRYLLLFFISGVIIYFFILEHAEKNVVNFWLSEVQKTVFYGFDLLRDFFHTYFG